MTSTPIGTFHAHSTRDAEALKRDGSPYFAIHRLQETCKPAAERDLFEIQFEDGLWMLARLDDLVAWCQVSGGANLEYSPRCDLGSELSVS